MYDRSTQIRVKKALKNLSSQDFLNFGLNHVAYIKVVDNDGLKHYSIHSADGHDLFQSPSLAHAIIETRLHDLEPVTVH
ncbi:MAG: DUF1150 domain-containing protein [Alphaproteobacteria bacterium]|nr:DUF1150 domain-containing protein [Alphaproteobacteria bacterium]